MLYKIIVFALIVLFLYFGIIFGLLFLALFINLISFIFPPLNILVVFILRIVDFITP